MARISLISLVASCLALVHLSQAGPSFCNGLDCPVFNVINSTKDYEVRHYPTSYWTSTTIEGRNFSYATGEGSNSPFRLYVGFNRLFNYISGANAQHQKVPMTAPVEASVVPGQGPFCDSTYEVSFFVPFDLQPNKAPQPVLKRVIRCSPLD